MKRNLFIFTVLFLSSIFSAYAADIQDTTSEAIAHAPSISRTQAEEGMPVEAPSHKIFSLQNAELKQDVCPPVESLVRDDPTQGWSGPGGWKTTSPSFLRSVDTFVGAQWVGVSIGEVICIYIKTTRSAFPVMLKRGKLVPAPISGGLWSEDKGGHMECKSNDVQHCAFWIQVPKKAEDVYEQLDFYKGKPIESN